jgi:predicted nucleotide-binding protein
VISEHEYKVRHKDELVGEMAVIDPGAPRSASLDAAVNHTTVFQISTEAFHRVASAHPQLWEGIARVLADRLRQRDSLFVPPNEKPVVFIASSREGADIRDKAVASLGRPTRELRPWNKPGIFRPTRNTLEELERHAREVDFAVIVVTPDDLNESRGLVRFIPRDNILIEFGIFMGALERDRAFLLVKGDPDLALASDLHGVTVLYFENDDELADKLREVDASIDEQGRMFRLKRADC